jgi:Ribosomal protein L36.
MRVQASVKRLCRNCKIIAARVWFASFAAIRGTSNARVDLINLRH